MYSVYHNNVFIALVATTFDRSAHHQANTRPNLKRLVTCSAQNVRLYGIPFTSMSVFVTSLKFAIYNIIYRGSNCRKVI
jgi:hypothetical protein